MTLEQMKAALRLSRYPACFTGLYTQIQDSWEDRAALILSEDYIYTTLTDCYHRWFRYTTPIPAPRSPRTAVPF